MKAIVYGDQAVKQELFEREMNMELFYFVPSFNEMLKEDADLYFVLSDNYSNEELKQLPIKPIIINSVTRTLSELNLPAHICRMNGWTTFLKRKVWEVSGAEAIFSNLFDRLGLDYSIGPDVPGFVSGRLVSMIINEAYFALGENVSTKADIDTAMRLGTNYPYGPFEWASKIGCEKVLSLLNVLSINNDIYTPAPLLIKEAVN